VRDSTGGQALFIKDLIALFTAPAFHAAYRVAPWIIGGQLFTSLCYIPANFLLLKKKTRLLPLVTVLAGAANVGLNLWLAPHYGTMAAAWVTFLCYGLMLILAWDAFQDGTINPENQPYTITTAIVLEGLLDALALPSFWTDAERLEIHEVLVQVSLHWCQDVWTQDTFGGFFWSSPNYNDAYFVLNASAMLLGSMERFLSEQGDAFSDIDQQFVQMRTTFIDGQPYFGGPA
jgi:hypothetical protein